LQFIVYARGLEYKTDSLGSTAYRKVVFKLRDFLEFQDPSVKLTNHYRLTKIKEFFQHFRRFKINSKSLIANVLELVT
jgi:hypothetical protein